MRRGVKPIIAGFAGLCLIVSAVVATAATRPAHAATGTGSKGPVGWDLYRHLDQLTAVPVGVKTKQFSSFDRAGGNGDFLHTLGRTASGGFVLAQQDGPGEIDSIWTTSNGGNVTQTGNIHVVLDGKVVLNAPEQDVVDGKVGAPFVFPLVANASQSSGGATILVPMPYRQSMLVWTDHDPIYYHVTYRTFPDAVGVNTFDPSDPATDVINELKAAGTADPKPPMPGATTESHALTLAPGKSLTLADGDGPGELTALRLHLPQLVSPPKPSYVDDDGRAFGVDNSAYSQFTAKIDPNNQGVRLTRRFDAGIGHQVANILVDGQQVASWAPLPVQGGCNWVDQSVNLPASATAGKSQITIRNVFTSSDLDFNEFTYWVDSNLGGQLTRTDTIDVGPNHTADETAHNYTINKQTWEGERNFCYPPTNGDPAALAASNDVLSHVRLRISFDGTQTVDAPLGEFFGTGLGFNPVRSLMYGVDTDTHWLSAWWPMPYRDSATVTLYNGSQQTVTNGEADVTSAESADVVGQLGPNGQAGYFHATSHLGHTTPGQDHVFLKTGGSGKFVGVSTTMRGDAGFGRGYLEGDERVYVDGAQSPTVHGTGSEDFYEGGWYFNFGPFSDPVNGNTAQMGSGQVGCDTDCVSAYRLMLTDAVPWNSSVTFGIEHGGTDDVPATYGSTAYWYGRPQVTMLTTDTLRVGDAPSERAHGYSSSDPGDVGTLTATYEGNNGTPRPMTSTLRATTAPVSFHLMITPQNRGVQLRRMSDQQNGYQSAEVFVDGQDAGTWLQPLANGDHRWLDDYFTLPAVLTAGKSTLTIRLVPTSGAPAWSAAGYSVQTEIQPRLDMVPPSKVAGVTATTGNGNAIAVSWQPASDNVGVDHYEVFASRDSAFALGPQTLVGGTAGTSFTLDKLGLLEKWYVRVRAVDASGNSGAASAAASATTGDTLRIEAESLLPPVESTAPAQVQTNCCGIAWSGGAQLWIRPTAAGQHITLAFTVPETGTYDLSAVQTKAGDYGINTLAIDGTQLGNPFDAYNPGVVLAPPTDYGTVNLAAGRHTLTVSVSNRNPSSTGYLAGIDYLQMHLVS